MEELSYGLAFAAGLVSFFSPCIFPLMPAYLSQLTGTSVSAGAVLASRGVIVSRSLGFVAGFTVIFVLLGASSTFIGQLFWEYRRLFEQIGGIIIVLFGLQMARVISIRALLSEKRFKEPKPSQSASFSRSLLLGFLFGTGWSPCIGLVLSSILFLASQSGQMWNGMFMLFVYSIGLGIPFLLVALLWSKSLHKIRRIHRWLPLIQQVSGILMIILGVMLFTGAFSTLAAYFARFAPMSF
ncbi:cytochrome c biogenesis CcdA family protein [Shouchella shacheensis]|uniref:cytochrome c biogenesis CcdA family protein n=1 Tax=Shouchella shacheensis TaxID=1649580 RepID=UPI00073FCFC4|nr:cytochrome c biogenesis CcdA family protein [Shouchella shacheensis]